jgi:hypothetical protein
LLLVEQVRGLAEHGKAGQGSQACHMTLATASSAVGVEHPGDTASITALQRIPERPYLNAHDE